MLRALPEKQKTRWRDRLSKVVHTYNCTRHDSTGFSPFYLLFGRTPRLPIDLMFGLRPPEGYSTYPEYVRNWRRAMKEAYHLASVQTRKSADMGKRQYDKKVRHAALCEGDFSYETRPNVVARESCALTGSEKFMSSLRKGRICRFMRSNQCLRMEGQEFCIVIYFYHAPSYLLRHT